VGLHEAVERVAEVARARCVGQFVDEVGCCGEEWIEAILERSIDKCDGEMGLAAARLTFEDDEPTLVTKSGAKSEPMVVSFSVDW
jgi:hypothetical protein